MATCGNCKTTGVEARTVKACYQGTANAHGVTNPADLAAVTGARTATVRVERSELDQRNHENWERQVARFAQTTGAQLGPKMATGGQLNYLRDLVAKVADVEGWDTTILPTVEEALTKLTMDQASAQIEQWKTLLAERAASQPKAQPAADPKAPAVPDGRYALREADGVVRFYKIKTPAEGKWAGFTFIDIQASDELYPVKNRDRKMQILAAVAQDVLGALRLYGTEIGACGHCNRTLTDEESRAFGIGPKCRAKLGI
jgi:hypothetical protein